MKVTGTQTTVESVEVTLSDTEVLRIAKSLDVTTLTEILADRLNENFIKGLTGGKKGNFFIAERFWSKNKRGCPSSGDGNYLTLIEKDADWNYHNNVGEDEDVRVLTDEEVIKYQMLCGVPGHISSLQK